MKKSKYRYNLQTLTYEKVNVSIKDRLYRFLFHISLGLVFAAVFIVLVYSLVDSPKEKMLRRENAQLKTQYEFMNKKLEVVSNSLVSLQQRDDNIYRIIFEAEPITKEERNAGFGGVNRYKNLEGFNNSELIISTSKRLDKLAKQMYVQSKSFDELLSLAEQKEKMLASIPAIQPVANEDLTRMASGYGNRIHPIYKTEKMHWGMDFTANTGIEIYSTGNGKVETVENSNKGYGNHVVVNHGYGYKTLYAHMSKVKVRPGQKVSRGDVLGFVGSTGTSTAPHLHYEVIKDGEKINPVNFYFNDLSPDEFDRMLEISSSNNQSFD